MRKLCRAAGCEEVALEGLAHCGPHEEQRQAKIAERKAKAQLSAEAQAGRKLYASSRWQKAARQYLIKNPVCIDCAGLGAVEPSTDVDHIKPHRGDQRVFWDRSNWQALCHRCHSRKTAREVLHRGAPGVVK